MELYAVLFVVLAILFLGLYFIPTYIALGKKHKNKGGVFLLNLVLGFTFFGWIASLLWAFYKEKEVKRK